MKTAPRFDPNPHGFTRMKTLGPGVKATSIDPEFREQAKKDLAYLEETLNKIPKRELVRFLESAGKWASMEERKNYLVTRAANTQFDSWYPEKEL